MTLQNYTKKVFYIKKKVFFNIKDFAGYQLIMIYFKTKVCFVYKKFTLYCIPQIFEGYSSLSLYYDYPILAFFVCHYILRISSMKTFANSISTFGCIFS